MVCNKAPKQINEHSMSKSKNSFAKINKEQHLSLNFLKPLQGESVKCSLKTDTFAVLPTGYPYQSYWLAAIFAASLQQTYSKHYCMSPVMIRKTT